MSIHSNSSYQTAPIIDSSHPEDNHSSIPADKRVEGVAFDVLCSAKPCTKAEEIRFKLEEHVKTGSQSYTIVTWNDKKYRITVHKDKSLVSYSEGDWKRLGDNLKTKIWDKAHPGEHFSKGTLALNAKTRKKWNVTLNNPTYTERPIAKKIIKDLKNLFEKELTALNLTPAPKSSPNKSKITPPIRKNLPETAQEKNVFEQAKRFLSKTRFLSKPKDRFFPTPRKEEFDDLTSETTSLFEEISIPRTEDEFDLISDTTSIGGNSEITDVLDDQRLPYSPKINQR
jgi:hypothetical protein